MPPPSWHRLQLEVVTSAFLGRFPESDPPVASGEIPFPVPSLRGVLAYWLRTLAGPYIGDDITQLLRVESELFGAAAGAGRPSHILLRSERVPVSAPPDKSEVGSDYLDLAYLMGPGLISDDEPRPRRLRPRRVTVSLRNLGGELHADLLLSALWALRAFGGVGARSRRGFGTLAVADNARGTPVVARFKREWLIRDDIRDLPQVLGCVETAIAELGVPRGGFTRAPAYPCFAPGAFHAEEHSLGAGGTDLVRLAVLGKLLRDFRRPVTNRKGRQITSGYDEVIRPFSTGRTPESPFRDGALGLPVVYTLDGGMGSATVEPVVDDKSARRASPLWLRLTRVSGEWRLRSLALHAEWLPSEVKLRATSGGRSADVRKPSPDEVRETVDGWFAYVSVAARLGPPRAVLETPANDTEP